MNHRLKNLNRAQVPDMDWTVHETDYLGLNAAIDDILGLFNIGADGTFPKDDVDLLDLARWLPKICLLDFVMGDDGQLANVLVRFQGKDIGTFFGEHTRESVENLEVPQSTKRILMLSRRILELRHPVVCVSEGPLKDGDTLHGDVLFVPLTSRNESVVGAFAYLELQILPK